jgi:hypothetical protein
MKSKLIVRASSIAAAAVAALAASVAIAGCSSTDVVAKVANSSFKAVAESSADRVTWSEEDQSWVLSSPAGDTVAFSSDFARNNSGGSVDSDKPDVEFSFDAAPFVAAGLDIAKLPKVEGIKYELEDGRFMYHFELGSDKFAPDAKKSLEATFAEIVRTQRSRIGYHEKLDHYGIKLGGGNMLEWAKDMAKNDKDLVFVLDPAPFMAAGVDPAKIQGWSFAKVETRDDAGKAVVVDKLLKPFNLK